MWHAAVDAAAAARALAGLSPAELLRRSAAVAAERTQSAHPRAQPPNPNPKPPTEARTAALETGAPPLEVGGPPDGGPLRVRHSLRSSQQILDLLLTAISFMAAALHG